MGKANCITQSGGIAFGTGNNIGGCNSSAIGLQNGNNNNFTNIIGCNITSNRDGATFLNRISVTQLDACTCLPPQFGFYYDTATCIVYYRP
jgi:hypothetical protein